MSRGFAPRGGGGYPPGHQGMQRIYPPLLVQCTNHVALALRKAIRACRIHARTVAYGCRGLRALSARKRGTEIPLS